MQPTLLFPEIASSYYDFWAFSLELLQRSVSGELYVPLGDFVQFVTGLGDFFGRAVNGGYEPEMCRYMPLRRAVVPDSRSQVNQVLALLNDEASRIDYAAVLEAEPQALWRHWLGNLFNGLEYMEYAIVGPGSVVLNSGVHGGGEVAYFLAGMAGQATS